MKVELAELTEFVRQALLKNIERGEIADALRRAGWPQADIKSALDAFAEIEFPLPVPKPKPYISAREAFIYVVMFFALYVVNVNIGSLAFHYIDFWYELTKEFVSDRVRWDIASLIICGPVFVFLYGMVSKEIADEPARRQSKPRKGLTYLTLSVGAITLIGVMTVLVFNILKGELPRPFGMKLLTVGTLATINFLYFLWDVERDERGSPSRN